jgi:hypothetical protein
MMRRNSALLHTKLGGITAEWPTLRTRPRTARSCLVRSLSATQRWSLSTTAALSDSFAQQYHTEVARNTRHTACHRATRARRARDGRGDGSTGVEDPESNDIKVHVPRTELLVVCIGHVMCRVPATHGMPAGTACCSAVRASWPCYNAEMRCDSLHALL